MKLGSQHVAAKLALILSATLAPQPQVSTAATNDASRDELAFFIEANGANSTAPVNIVDVLKGQDPTQQYNTRYKPRAQWRDQVKTGFVKNDFELYVHMTKLGRIKTDNPTLNFWSEFNQTGFAPEEGKRYRVSWDYLSLETTGIGAQFKAISTDALKVHIGANLAVVDSLNQRRIDAEVQRTGNTSTLNANISKTSTTPDIPQLQSGGSGQAAWFHLQLAYAQPFSPLSMVFQAPILLGSARIHDAAFINTNLNFSETNKLLKNNSQSPRVGAYGNTHQHTKLPNFWDLKAEYAHSPSSNPVLFIEGVDASSAVYVGNVWKSFFTDRTDLELLVDKELQTFLVYLRAQGHYSVGVGLNRLNANAPVSFRFSYRY